MTWLLHCLICSSYTHSSVVSSKLIEYRVNRGTVMFYTTLQEVTSPSGILDKALCLELGFKREVWPSFFFFCPASLVSHRNALTCVLLWLKLSRKRAKACCLPETVQVSGRIPAIISGITQMPDHQLTQPLSVLLNAWASRFCLLPSLALQLVLEEQRAVAGSLCLELTENWVIA